MTRDSLGEQLGDVLGEELMAAALLNKNCTAAESLRRDSVIDNGNRGPWEPFHRPLSATIDADLGNSQGPTSRIIPVP